MGEDYYFSGEEWNIYNTKPIIDTEALVEVSKCVVEKVKSIDRDSLCSAVELFYAIYFKTPPPASIRAGLTACRLSKDVEFIFQDLPDIVDRAKGIMKSDGEIAVKGEKFFNFLVEEAPEVLNRLNSITGGLKGVYSTASNTLGFANGKVKEGSRGWLYFGKNKVCRERFHKEIKKDIFKNAGDFRTKVGKNPDVKVINGKIRLKGADKNFQNKYLDTNLDASDFFDINK